VKHCGDLHDVVSQTRDDAVVAVNDLAHRLVTKLGHDTSRMRMSSEPAHGGDDPFDDKVGTMSGVTGDMDAFAPKSWIA
jgi:hypothetical protein